MYGFFFPSIFELVTDPADERFNGLPPELVRAMASGFAAGYAAPGPDVAWFEQIRILAGSLGFALKQKDYKKNPDAYPGSIRDASFVIRVLLTGARQSPDLEQVADALGRDEVLRRGHRARLDLGRPRTPAALRSESPSTARPASPGGALQAQALDDRYFLPERPR